MLKNGERQVAPTRDGIRRDHVARYEFAAQSMSGDDLAIIDVACGVGYGARILAEAGASVAAVDYSKEALDYAKEHYAHARVKYHLADVSDGAVLPPAHAAVCYETIEHLEDPRPLLSSLNAAAQILFASVPNEEVYPDKHVAFHHRHYTRRDFEQLLNECGWKVLEWWGQTGPESDVEPNVSGQTLIAVCTRDERCLHREPPEHVAICGIGPSLNQYVEVTKSLGGRRAYCDEVWGVNCLGDVFACDVVFHMDDVRIQEIRAEARPGSNVAHMVDWLKGYRGPVITSRAHEDYPGLIEFPLEAVLNDLGHDYFNNTVAYAIAYAIHIGVKKLSIFGCDYTYPNAHDAEKGRACVEFWLGYARARGINLVIAKTSSLMDALYDRAERLYGYDTVDVAVNVQDDGSVQVEMAEREKLPTADEIEARYDHAKHPNAMVSAAEEKPCSIES